MKPTPTKRLQYQQLAERARALLSRIEETDSCGCGDFEAALQSEQASVQLIIDLLEKHGLTDNGLTFVEELLAISEESLAEEEKRSDDE